MSLAPFAALESRVTNAVFARLANSAVVIDGAPEVGGIFDDGFVIGSVGPMGMGGTQPSVAVASTVVPPAVVGLPVTVAGVPYIVADAQPDGTGITRLILEVA